MRKKKTCLQCGAEYTAVSNNRSYCTPVCRDAFHRERRARKRLAKRYANGDAVTLAERIEAYAIPEPNTGCFLWSRTGHKAGYGQIGDGGKTLKAHRVAYELAFGEIPDGFIVCHRCDTPQCVNPDHLFLGTSKDNTQDMMRKGRHRPSGDNKKKLNMGRAKRIRALRRNGARVVDLAEEFGVTDRQIRNICFNRAWVDRVTITPVESEGA